MAAPVAANVVAVAKLAGKFIVHTSSRACIQCFIILTPYDMPALEEYFAAVRQFSKLAIEKVTEQKQIIDELRASEAEIADVVKEVAQELPAPVETLPVQKERSEKNGTFRNRVLYYAKGIQESNLETGTQSSYGDMSIDNIVQYLTEEPFPQDEDERWRRIYAINTEIQFDYMKIHGGIGQIFLKLKPKGKKVAGKPDEKVCITVDNKSTPPTIQLFEETTKFQSPFTQIFQQLDGSTEDSIAALNLSFCQKMLDLNLKSIELGNGLAVVLAYGQSGSGKTFSMKLLYDYIDKHLKKPETKAKLIGVKAFQFYNDCIRNVHVIEEAVTTARHKLHIDKKHDRTLSVNLNFDGKNSQAQMKECPLPLILSNPTSKKLYYPYNGIATIDKPRAPISYTCNEAKTVSGSSIEYNESQYQKFVHGAEGPGKRPSLQAKVSSKQHPRLTFNKPLLDGPREELSHLFYDGAEEFNTYFHRFYDTRLYDMFKFPNLSQEFVKGQTIADTKELKIIPSEMQKKIPYLQFSHFEQGSLKGRMNGSNYATFDHSELMYPMFFEYEEKNIDQAYIDEIDKATMHELNGEKLDDLIKRISKARFTRTMLANDDSSRSQLVVELHFENGSKMVMMDLAGNENVMLSSRENQISFYEGVYINETLDYVRQLTYSIMSKTKIAPNNDAFAKYLSTLTAATLTLLVCAFESSPPNISGIEAATRDAFDFVHKLYEKSTTDLTGQPAGPKVAVEKPIEYVYISTVGGNKTRVKNKKYNYKSYVNKVQFRKNKTVYKKWATRKNRLRRM